MSLISIVVQGSIKSDGFVSGPMNYMRNLKISAWEYKFSSVEITPISQNLDLLLEISSTFNCADQYDYELRKILPRPSVYSLLRLQSNRGVSQFFDFSNNQLWIPVEDVREAIQVSLTYAGTGRAVTETLEMTAHVLLRRRQ